jgi:hypothetical protein
VYACGFSISVRKGVPRVTKEKHDINVVLFCKNDTEKKKLDLHKVERMLIVLTDQTLEAFEVLFPKIVTP